MLGGAEGSDDATIVGDSLGLGEGMELLYDDGLFHSFSLGPDEGRDVGEWDGS